MTAPLRFVLLLEIIGLAALPLSAMVFARLPCAASAFAKPLGLLAVGWLTWLAGSVGLGHGPGISAVAIVLVAGLGLVLAWPHRTEWAGTLRSRRHWAGEAVFLASFAVLAVVTAHAPDVWGTEKPMDMALITAIGAADSLPPPNPWLSGAELDGYYYVGHLLAAMLIGLSGVAPDVGYNCALAAFFALAVVASFGLGAALAGAAGRPPIRFGLLTVALTMLAGNLAGAVEFVRLEGPLAGYDWFAASRVVPGTINEFPAFSWLLGDLHAHVMAVPLTLIALALALQWLHAGPHILDLVAAAVVGGLLYAINSWSYPVVAGTLALALLAGPGTGAERWRNAGALIGLSALAVLPFLLSFEPPAAGFGLVTDRRTLALSLRDAVLTVGLPAWLVAGVFLVAARPSGRARRGAFLVAVPAVIAVGAVSGAALGWVALLAVLAGVAARRLFLRDLPAPEHFLWLAALSGLFCLVLPELVFVSDAFAGSGLERMNTVFKLGYQAWLLFAVAGVAALLVCPSTLPPLLRVPWLAGALVLGVAAAVFPLAGAYARTDGFSGPPTLSGLAWLARAAPGDVEAIAWLRRHAGPDAVVLESAGDDYSADGHARISTFTGRSTVIGWEGHVLQWGGDPGRRRADVSAMYREPDAAAARPLLRSYGVDHVVVGPLERSDHGTAGVAKWDELGSRVFSRAGTTVWRLTP